MRKIIICVVALSACLLSSGCLGLIVGKSSRPRSSPRTAPEEEGLRVAPEGERVRVAPALKGDEELFVVVFCEDATKPMSQFLEMHFPQAKGWGRFEFQGKDKSLVVRDNGEYVKLVSGRGLIKYGTVGIAVDGRDVAVKGAFLPQTIRVIAVLADGSLASVEEPEPTFPEPED